MKDIRVIAIGEEVTFKHGLKGTVLAVTVYAGGRVEYSVAWWDGAERKAQWVTELELDIESEAKPHINIGFKE